MERKPTVELKMLLNAIPAQHFDKTEQPVPEKLREVHAAMANAAIRYGFSSFEVLNDCVVMNIATDHLTIRVQARGELGYRAVFENIAVEDNPNEPLTAGTHWCQNIEQALQELNKVIVIERAAAKNEE